MLGDEPQSIRLVGGSLGRGGAVEPEDQIKTMEDALREEDLRALEFELIGYQQLPDRLETDTLEPEFGYDARRTMLERFTFIEHMAREMLPKFQQSSDIELLRRAISIIQTAMRVVAIIDECNPPNYENYSDNGKAILQRYAISFRQKIKHIFQVLRDKILSLEN